MVLRDVPPDSAVVGVPAHIVYQAGKRVLITEPREVNDPLSDVIIALADEVAQLKARVERLDGELQQAARQAKQANALIVEDEERASTEASSPQGPTA